MADWTGQAGKLGVFISYSRDDLDFADQLEAALKLYGFTTTIDRHGISGGEEWRRRLGTLIRDADTVIFVLSPASAQSPVCKWEVEEAVRLGKRIIPVLSRQLDSARPPPQLADLNYVFFYPEPHTPGSGFGTGLNNLVAALNTDLEWLREHTRLLLRATEWQTGGQPANRLLSGADIAAAKAWAARRPKDAPEPTALHLDFIKASEAREATQESEELRRHAERERLKREAQLAQLERDTSRRVMLRTLIGAVAATVLALVAAGFGFFAWQQRQAAVAVGQVLVQTRDELLLNQSRSVTGAAKQALEQGDPATAFLLALEVLRDEKGGDVARARSHSALAAAALSAAIREFREQRVLRGHADIVHSVALMPDGKRIVTGSSDRTARIWDAATGKELLQLKNHNGLVWGVAVSRDGARIVTGAWGGGQGGGQVLVWDAKTGERLRELKGHTNDVNGVAVTPDGRVLTGSDDQTARVWALDTGAELLQLKGHTGMVYGVAVTPDGARIVTTSADKTARVWDAKNGAELIQLKGHTDAVYCVAVTPDGARIVTGSNDKTARVWDAKTGAELIQLKGHASGVLSAAVMPGGARVVTGSADGTILLWDLETGTQVLQLKGHTGAVTSLALAPDGTLVTGSSDKTARIWDIAPRSGGEALPIKGHSGDIYGLAVSPDGSRIATASVDKTARIWNSKTGAELLQLKGHTDTVNAVALSPDRVITASNDKTVRIWEANTGTELLQLKGHTDGVVDVAVSADGMQIITGSADRTARIWNAKTGALLRKLDGHTNTVWAVVLDGTRAITGADDGTARIWDAETGSEVRRLEGHTSGIVDIALTPDRARVVTASNDGTARIWDAGTGKELIQLKGHASAVAGVVVTADGGRIVTTSGDGTIRIWDAKSGEELVQLQSNIGSVYGLALTMDGRRLVTGNGPTGVRVWELPPTGQALIDEAKRITTRCLTPAQRKSAYLPVRPPEWCGQMEKWPYDSVSAFIEGPKLIAEGKEEEGETVLASVGAKNPAVAKRIDEARATGYIEEGARLLERGSEGQATEVFGKAVKHDPAAAKRIDEILVNSYIARGTVLARDGRQEGAEVAFAKALARDPGAAKRIDKAWADAYLSRGVILLEAAKDEEAEAFFAKALARDPGAKRIDDVRVDSYIGRGRKLLVSSKDEEAEAFFAKALARDPSAAKRIDDVRVDSYIDRGQNHVVSGKEQEAKAAFAKALARDPDAGKRVEEAWVRGFIDRGSNLLGDAVRDGKSAEKLRADALASFEQAVARARRDGPSMTLLADALHGRGRAFDGLKRYREAVDDFKEAIRLGHPFADSWLWWATDGLADQMRDQGNPVHALLMTTINYLDLTPELKKTIGLKSLKSNGSTWTGISTVYVVVQKSSGPQTVTDCDQLAGHPEDPYGTAPGLKIDAIIAPAAIAACDKDIKKYPQQPRYLYQRARAHSRAADLATDDKTKANASYEASIADLKVAMAAGYPMAFNNMAFALRNGQGIAKDEDGASDLYLETFNRVIHCCWVPVARHVLEQENQYDVPTVRRVVRELLMWADALGSEPAGQMLTELYAKGTLVRPSDSAALGKADFKSLPPWLR